MGKRLGLIGVLVVVAGIVASGALFTVSETEQVIVVQFGEPKQVIQEPGLNVKIPFIQEVRRYERRILEVDPPVEQVILADQRRLDVDAFVRYQITDPLRFFQSVTNENGARARISTVTNAALRRVLGNQTQLAVLSGERADIMRQIQDEVEALTEQSFGVNIIDVRVGRADVPQDTVQSVYDRMASERQREAAEFRAQGEEQAQQIRARADREVTVLLAEAEWQAQILRGQGDAEAIRILADAYGQDESFFGFFRTLQAYRNSIGDQDTTMVLAPEGEFFRFFHNLDGSVITALGLDRAAPSGDAADQVGMGGPADDAATVAGDDATPAQVARPVAGDGETAASPAPQPGTAGGDAN